MKKSLTIRIPEPCHEDWGKMSQTEKGKHCAVCTKEVVDFTKQSDEAIIKHVLKNENACGRFTTKQINREMTLERKSTVSLAPYAASLLLPLTLLNGQQAQATINEKPAISLGIGSHTTTERVQVTITGTITDKNGAPINDAKVTVLETNQVTYTNAKGNYTITTLNDNTLVFSKGKLEQQDIKIGRKNTVMNIVLLDYQMIQSHILGRMKAVPSRVIKGDIAVVADDISKAKEITISGKVTDNNNIPLPGVNIIIKGTTIGTQTDFDGNYSIETPSNQVLSFHYLGFNSQEITLSNINNIINIELAENYDIMGEIVIGGIFP